MYKNDLSLSLSLSLSLWPWIWIRFIQIRGNALIVHRPPWKGCIRVYCRWRFIALLLVLSLDEVSLYSSNLVRSMKASHSGEPPPSLSPPSTLYAHRVLRLWMTRITLSKAFSYILKLPVSETWEGFCFVHVVPPPPPPPRPCRYSGFAFWVHLLFIAGGMLCLLLPPPPPPHFPGSSMNDIDDP